MIAVFLDRDGTLIVDPADLRVDSISDIRLFPDSISALQELSRLPVSVFMITNQAGIAEGLIDEREFEVINNEVVRQLAVSGLHIIKTYMCPHTIEADCSCRKPKPGMLLQAAEEYDIDLASSYMIGDRQSDVSAGVNAGAKSILVETGNNPATADGAVFVAATLTDAIRYIAEDIRVTQS